MSKSLKESLWVIAALVAVILIPVALRSRQARHAHADETLVIISPHNEAVRFEFTRAFTEAHFRKTGRTVYIDWRTPGGTSEIARYLAAEFLGAFQYHWEQQFHQPWSVEVQTAFDNPKVKRGNDTPAARARAAFLDSNVGCGIDLFFGGGSYDFGQQAAAGRLVPVDLLKNETRFPQTLGGEILRDSQGRWAGCALSAFGICYNTDALRRIGFAGTPEQWADLARPELKGAVALADPTQSGSVAKAFELIVQQQIAEAGGNTTEGWRRAFILIRRIAGNSRYFSDSATRIVWDVESGDAAAGMSIDFYGRMQSDSARRPDGTSRMGYVTPRGGSSFGADPIGLLRGAPSPELAREFIAFVLSPDGQKLWNWKVGVPGGPVRYALRRLPVLPELYDAKDDSFRSDPGVNPYTWAKNNPPYHPEWTASLFRTIAFLIQATAIDPHEELCDAWDALIAHGFPPQATAAFEDNTGMDYQTANQVLKPALASGQKIDQARLSRELCDRARGQYRRAAELAREGK